jgi:energy-coupling factor transporter transmembrane protein EcfT
MPANAAVAFADTCQRVLRVMAIRRVPLSKGPLYQCITSLLDRTVPTLVGALELFLVFSLNEL